MHSSGMNQGVQRFLPHGYCYFCSKHLCTNQSGTLALEFFSRVGVTRQISSVRAVPLFLQVFFSVSSKHCLPLQYRIHIWQVWPQLSCDGTCQMWMWFQKSNWCFCKLWNFPNGDISEWNISNPQSSSPLEKRPILYSTMRSMESSGEFKGPCLWIVFINSKLNENTSIFS